MNERKRWPGEKAPDYYEAEYKRLIAGGMQPGEAGQKINEIKGRDIQEAMNETSRKAALSEKERREKFAQDTAERDNN